MDSGTVAMHYCKVCFPKVFPGQAGATTLPGRSPCINCGHHTRNGILVNVVAAPHRLMFTISPRPRLRSDSMRALGAFMRNLAGQADTRIGEQIRELIVASYPVVLICQSCHADLHEPPEELRPPIRAEEEPEFCERCNGNAFAPGDKRFWVQAQITR